MPFRKMFFSEIFGVGRDICQSEIEQRMRFQMKQRLSSYGNVYINIRNRNSIFTRKVDNFEIFRIVWYIILLFMKNIGRT